MLCLSLFCSGERERERERCLNWVTIFMVSFNVFTCRMKRDAQAKVAMIRKMEPLNQSLSLVSVVLVTYDWRG